MRFRKQDIGKAIFIFSSLIVSQLVSASDGHDRHGNEHVAPAQPSTTPARIPALSIAMPGDDDTLGQRMAVVIETDADLAAHTMSSGKAGMHLHIDIGDQSVMPTHEQFASLGGNRYAYVFDLPVKAGAYQLCVSWAGADHRTIESSVRCRSIKVR